MFANCLQPAEYFLQEKGVRYDCRRERNPIRDSAGKDRISGNSRPGREEHGNEQKKKTGFWKGIRMDDSSGNGGSAGRLR